MSRSALEQPLMERAPTEVEMSDLSRGDIEQAGDAGTKVEAAAAAKPVAFLTERGADQVKRSLEALQAVGQSELARNQLQKTLNMRVAPKGNVAQFFNSGVARIASFTGIGIAATGIAQLAAVSVLGPEIVNSFPIFREIILPVIGGGVGLVAGSVLSARQWWKERGTGKLLDRASAEFKELAGKAKQKEKEVDGAAAAMDDPILPDVESAAAIASTMPKPDSRDVEELQSQVEKLQKKVLKLKKVPTTPLSKQRKREDDPLQDVELNSNSLSTFSSEEIKRLFVADAMSGILREIAERNSGQLPLKTASAFPSAVGAALQLVYGSIGLSKGASFTDSTVPSLALAGAVILAYNTIADSTARDSNYYELKELVEAANQKAERMYAKSVTSVESEGVVALSDTPSRTCCAPKTATADPEMFPADLGKPSARVQAASAATVTQRSGRSNSQTSF